MLLLHGGRASPSVLKPPGDACPCAISLQTALELCGVPVGCRRCHQTGDHSLQSLLQHPNPCIGRIPLSPSIETDCFCRMPGFLPAATKQELQTHWGFRYIASIPIIPQALALAPDLHPGSEHLGLFPTSATKMENSTMLVFHHGRDGGTTSNGAQTRTGPSGSAVSPQEAQMGPFLKSSLAF